MNIIPMPKILKEYDGIIEKKTVKLISNINETRILNAVKTLPLSDDGIPLTISYENNNREGYTLSLSDETVRINGEGVNGAFYAIQTLRQIFSSESFGPVYIEDEPEMEYRGFYHDVTRGKIPKIETLKELVDKMAYYKLNSLQLYVEHVFEFEEYEDCREKLGCLTKEEIIELDNYCSDRFVELIPSLSCFGHLYHLLQTDKYKHLCELKDYKPDKHYWIERMMHHTINPMLEESYELVTSFIDRYSSLFQSNYFNICCDETFDLGCDINKECNKSDMYIGFVNKLIKYLESKEKKVMLWGDMVLKYSERVDAISDEAIFLNWSYVSTPVEEQFEAFKKYDRKQIVCPGTSSWNAFSDHIEQEEQNIGCLLLLVPLSYLF